jgi:hypothetical protein
MIIHFAPTFDGMQPMRAVTVAGTVALGPARLLDLLELRLGLPPAAATPGRALLLYERCLAECDNEQRFYHRSFRENPLDVARSLLAWRSTWYEHGWSGSFAAKVSSRLADMAAVEAVARGRVPLTAGQRIQRVLASLDQGLATGIERIVVHETPADLPRMWQALLSRLSIEIAAGVSPVPCADPDTDLGQLQRGLVERFTTDDAAPRAMTKLRGDRTFIVVRAVSRDLSAQAVAEYLRARTGAIQDTVVIAEHDGVIVDNALERVGLPRTGFQHHSRFRAVTQVLKLCLALVWDPIDPRLLLQFLIHPVGPLPRHVRSELAAAVAREPGIGGTAWREALVRIAERERTRYGKSDEEVNALLRDIAYWLDCARHEPRSGAPIAALIERATRCTLWLTGRLHGLDENDGAAALYVAAVAQGEALVAALGELHERGDSHVARIALEQIIDEVGSVAADPAAFGHAGHVRATTSPGAITPRWARMIWWDLAPHETTPSYTWSEQELGELAREAVELPAIDERIRIRLRAWLRPILNAEREVMLVIHDRDEGHHPLWTQIESAFEGFAETRIEDALLMGTNGRAHASAADATVPVIEVPVEPLKPAPLVSPRRWWRLPSNCAIPRPTGESYSSLNSLIFHPHRWVLERAAGLRAGRAADLVDGTRLYGNLSHRLLERFFAAFPNWASLDDRVIDSWVGDFLPLLIRQEGALLCERGHGVVRERIQAQLARSLTRLLHHLRGARIVSVAPEMPGKATFADTELSGRIDLLLTDAARREIVLDVKWGGQDYRAEELSNNLHLQLASYAFLRRTPAGDWPYQAFYIAATGNVVAPDRAVFPNALIAPSVSGENAEALWQRVTSSYRWRRAQLAAGKIEVTAEGTQADDDSVPPLDALEVDGGPDRFDPFTWLTGWEDGT